MSKSHCHGPQNEGFRSLCLPTTPIKLPLAHRPDSGPPTSPAAPQNLEESLDSAASFAAPVSNRTTPSISDGGHSPPVETSFKAAVNQAYKHDTLHQVFRVLASSSLSNVNPDSSKTEAPTYPHASGSSRKRKISSAKKPQSFIKKPKSVPGVTQSPTRQRASQSAICKGVSSLSSFVDSKAQTLFVNTTSLRPCVFE